jgi:predicted peptidase
MIDRRRFLFSCLVAGAAIGLPAAWAADRIRGATAITEVFGDGIRLTAVALEYDAIVDGSKLTAADFRVDGRTVTEVFASASADPADRAATGRYVIVALSPDDAAAPLRKLEPPQGDAGQPGGDPADGPPAGGPKVIDLPATATVTPAGAGAVTTTAVKNLIVDDFRQLEFIDDNTGDRLKYNLFVPRDYDPKKSYPLVLFMHDAGATSDDPLTTLRQGLGAVVWASREDQARHPAFVLAPQYSGLIANDRSETTSMLDTTIHLVEKIATDYSIDRRRLYATGQSGGCMMSIAVNIKYPELFAASFLVAGQWDATLVKPLAKAKLWIVVSEGDLKAYPGQNAITAVLEREGAKVARAVWDGRSTPEEFAAAVAAMEAEVAPINYVALRKGTVVPAGQDDNGGGNHINTWRIAYTIEGIRDWIMAQRR